MNLLRKKAWSPYLVGAGIGVLSWLTFYSADKPIGITTTFENTAAVAERAVAPSITQPYFESKGNKSPKIDWQWMLVVGVFIGAFISSKMSGDRAPEDKVPPLWRWRFGGSAMVRYAGAFIGGVIMMFGARVAQGCTSGHGISGVLQLALSSWIFAPVMFITGIGVAFLLYGKEGRKHV